LINHHIDDPTHNNQLNEAYKISRYFSTVIYLIALMIIINRFYSLLKLNKKKCSFRKLIQDNKFILMIHLLVFLIILCYLLLTASYFLWITFEIEVDNNNPNSDSSTGVFGVTL